MTKEARASYQWTAEEDERLRKLAMSDGRLLMGREAGTFERVGEFGLKAKK